MTQAGKFAAVFAFTAAAIVVMHPAAFANEGGVTFAKDVVPILQRSCQKCHRPGTAAPMSLLTYKEARPWARAIKDRVVSRQMPPWHIDRTIGEYANDPSLSDEEVATIAQWVENGAPPGNPEDAPPPLDLPALDEWTFGEPDLVVSMKEGFAIPAEGADFYPSETVDPGFTEDMYVKWVQLLPGADCCVHHLHVYAVQPEGDDVAEELGLGVGSNTDNEVDLVEYELGNLGDYFPYGTTRILKAGTLFRFSPHYHPWGEETHDRSQVGLKFYPKGVVPELVVTSHRIRAGIGNDWILKREEIEELILREGHQLELDDRMPTGALIAENDLSTTANLSIPPNSIARHERYWPLPQHAIILNFQPHMHFRGSRMLLEAIHVDGRREVVTDVNKYEQIWQMTYRYKKPHVFQKGTILHAVSWHDNTANNRHNPDPSAWVGWGSRTMDEMANAWTDIAFLTDEQYEASRSDPEKTSTTEEGQ